MNVLPGEKVAANVGRNPLCSQVLEVFIVFKAFHEKKEEKASICDARGSFLPRISFNCEQRAPGHCKFTKVVSTDGGHDVQFQLDSRATAVNILPVREYKKVCGDPELKELKTLEAIFSRYNGSEIHPLGKKRITLM